MAQADTNGLVVKAQRLYDDMVALAATQATKFAIKTVETRVSNLESDCRKQVEKQTQTMQAQFDREIDELKGLTRDLEARIKSLDALFASLTSDLTEERAKAIEAKIAGLVGGDSGGQ